MDIVSNSGFSAFVGTVTVALTGVLGIDYFRNPQQSVIGATPRAVSSALVATQGIASKASSATQQMATRSVVYFTGMPRNILSKVNPLEVTKLFQSQLFQENQNLTQQVADLKGELVQANEEKEGAIQAKTAAEAARDTAIGEKTAAEVERDTAIQAKEAAETQRDEAVTNLQNHIDQSLVNRIKKFAVEMFNFVAKPFKYANHQWIQPACQKVSNFVSNQWQAWFGAQRAQEA